MAIGQKKLCVSKGCGGLRACCEHAQSRHNQQVEVLDLWAHPDNNHGGDGKGCTWFLTRQELGGDMGDGAPMPKFANKSAGKRRFIGKVGGRPLIRPDGSPLIIEGNSDKPLPEPPDLMVGRHIRNGRNINNDENGDK